MSDATIEISEIDIDVAEHDAVEPAFDLEGEYYTADRRLSELRTKLAQAENTLVEKRSELAAAEQTALASRRQELASGAAIGGGGSNTTDHLERDIATLQIDTTVLADLIFEAQGDMDFAAKRLTEKRKQEASENLAGIQRQLRQAIEEHVNPLLSSLRVAHAVAHSYGCVIPSSLPIVRFADQLDRWIASVHIDVDPQSLEPVPHVDCGRYSEVSSEIAAALHDEHSNPSQNELAVIGQRGWRFKGGRWAEVLATKTANGLEWT